MSTAQAETRMTPSQENDLLAVLVEQCALCRELTGLGERQRLLIAANQAEELLQVLGQRQGIIERLGALSQRIRPYQQNWPQVRSALGQETRQRVDEMVSEVNSHLANVMEGDRADAELLASRRQATGEDVMRLKATRLAGAAYAASQQGSNVSHVEWTDE